MRKSLVLSPYFVDDRSKIVILLLNMKVLSKFAHAVIYANVFS